ncbi:MAG: 50S ribosomal protein L5, partial [Nitrososphaerales archaeon]
MTKTIQDNKSSSQTEIDPRRVRIGKLVLNIGVGKSGEAIERARRVLEDLTHQKASSRKARKSIRDFGVHKGEPIGMMVTLRAASAY